jgi:excisionase family DNA binding protein
MMTSPEPLALDGLMDIRQVAEYLQISADMTYRYAATGVLPAFKLGNRWSFTRAALDAWMARRSAMQPKPARPEAF